MITQKSINELSYKIIGCAIEVHKHLGPGLLESVYEECLIEEMKSIGLKVKSQTPVPQLISYLKLAQKAKGLLINFHCENISNNVISLVTEEFAKFPK